MYPPNQLNHELQIAIAARDLKRVDQLILCGANVNFRTLDGHPVLHLAINYEAYPIAKRLLEVGADPRAVSTESFQKGYTALHLACLQDNHDLVELLITRYNVDLNAVAADGIQPIHLALLNDDHSIIRLMLAKSVSPETQINRIIFDKYYRGAVWRDVFGDDVTLLTFTVLYNKVHSAEILINYGANSKIKNNNGTTLLMYAVYCRYISIIKFLLVNLSRSAINSVDNDGFTAVHYIFKYEIRDYPELSVGEKSRVDYYRSEIVALLVKKGADINTLIHGDPATLLINMIAYLRDYQLLDCLLPRQKFLPIARPVFYNRLPDSIDYPSKYLPLVRKDDSTLQASYTFTDTIVKDIKLRIAMGYPVLSEEIDLLNSINQKYLRDNECHQVVSQLKYRILTFSNKRLSVYNVLSKTDSELKELSADIYFLQALDSYHRKAYDDEEKIVTMIKVRVDQLSSETLLNKLHKLSLFPDTFFQYIPFVCIVKIVKYLDVYDLRDFINAYYPLYY